VQSNPAVRQTTPDIRHLAERVSHALRFEHADAIAGLEGAGEAGRLEDVYHSAEVLLTALELDDPEIAIGYAGWLARVLASRGIQPAQLRCVLVLVPEAAAAWLCADRVERLRSIAAAAARHLGETSPHATAQEAAPDAGDAPTWAMTQALLEGNRRRAGELMTRAMDAGQTYGDAALAVVQPAMYTIGRLWEHNQVSVAQEHLATGIAQTVLAKAFLMATFAPEIGRRAVFACVPGNQHGLGLRIVADCFEIAGWEAQYLGADVPEAALLDQIRAWQPDLVGLSISMAAQIPAAQATIGAIRRAFGDAAPRILVGGLAANQLADAAAVLGGDGWHSDGRAALECAVA